MHWRRPELKEFPDRQRRPKTINRANVVPLIGVVVALILLMQSIFRINCLALDPIPKLVVRTTILDPGAAMALLSGFISLLFLRIQFLHSSLPVLTYRVETTRGIVSVTEGPSSKGPRIHIIELHNSGQGLATVTRGRYWLQFKDPDDQPHRPEFMKWFEQRRDVYADQRRFKLDYHGMEEELRREGFHDGENWAGINLGQGSAFGAGVKRRVMVIDDALALHLVAFDLQIEFESVLGDRFMRELYMVPRRQFLPVKK